MHLSEYLAAAAARQSAPSLRTLGRALSLSAQSVADLRHGRSLPSDATMLRLAELAGVPPERALLDLNCWRAGEPAASVYRAMLARLTTAATVLLALAGPVQARPLHVGVMPAKSIHYAMRVRQRGAVAP